MQSSSIHGLRSLGQTSPLNPLYSLHRSSSSLISVCHFVHQELAYSLRNPTTICHWTRNLHLMMYWASVIGSSVASSLISLRMRTCLKGGVSHWSTDSCKYQTSHLSQNQKEVNRSSLLPSNLHHQLNPWGFPWVSPHSLSDSPQRWISVLEVTTLSLLRCWIFVSAYEQCPFLDIQVSLWF